MLRKISRPDCQQVSGWVAEVNAAKVARRTTADRRAERAGREAFGHLHARFYRPLVAALGRRGVRPDAAHDLATDALLLLWQSPVTLDPDRSPLPFLVGVANNRRVSQWRRDRRARPLTAADHDALPAREPEPPVAAARRESARMLHAALDALPEPLGRVVERYRRGETRKAASARLRLTPRRLDTLRAVAVRALLATCPALAARG